MVEGSLLSSVPWCSAVGPTKLVGAFPLTNVSFILLPPFILWVINSNTFGLNSVEISTFVKFSGLDD